MSTLPDASELSRADDRRDTGPLTPEDIDQLVLKLRGDFPLFLEYFRPGHVELYQRIPPLVLMREEPQAERVHRSLRFYEALRPPTNWRLCDPTYEATDTSRRCWRVKLKKPLEDLQRQLRARKRRRNHR